LRNSPAQSALLNIKLNRQILDHSHAGEATAAYVRYVEDLVAALNERRAKIKGTLSRAE